VRLIGPHTVLTLFVMLLNSATTSAAQQESAEPTTVDRDASDVDPAPSTWKGAIVDSFRLLVSEHTTRIAFQDKTRRELGGNFFGDYGRSVRIPKTWEDGDNRGVNYVGHPIHGAAAGFIWLDHEDGAHDPDFGFSRE
jgi:hypothetical protein